MLKYISISLIYIGYIFYYYYAILILTVILANLLSILLKLKSAFLALNTISDKGLR